MSDKNVSASSENKINLYLNMRTKRGTISKTYISKLKTEYARLLKDKDNKVKGAKGKLKAFLNSEFKPAREKGIGLIFLDNGGVSARDIFISSDRQKYIKDANKAKALFHNVDIGAVKAKDKSLKMTTSALVNVKPTPAAFMFPTKTLILSSF